MKYRTPRDDLNIEECIKLFAADLVASGYAVPTAIEFHAREWVKLQEQMHAVGRTVYTEPAERPGLLVRVECGFGSVTIRREP